MIIFKHNNKKNYTLKQSRVISFASCEIMSIIALRTDTFVMDARLHTTRSPGSVAMTHGKREKPFADFMAHKIKNSKVEPALLKRPSAWR